MRWQISYFNRSVFKAISDMPMRIKARYVALADRMIERGPDLGAPYTAPPPEESFLESLETAPAGMAVGVRKTSLTGEDGFLRAVTVKDIADALDRFPWATEPRGSAV